MSTPYETANRFGKPERWKFYETSRDASDIKNLNDKNFPCVFATLEHPHDCVEGKVYDSIFQT